eukprot:140780-Pelagomonas_calceolata.AAC.6
MEANLLHADAADLPQPSQAARPGNAHENISKESSGYCYQRMYTVDLLSQAKLHSLCCLSSWPLSHTGSSAMFDSVTLANHQSSRNSYIPRIWVASGSSLVGRLCLLLHSRALFKTALCIHVRAGSAFNANATLKLCM